MTVAYFGGVLLLWIMSGNLPNGIAHIADLNTTRRRKDEDDFFNIGYWVDARRLWL